MFGFFHGKFQKFPKMHLGVQVSKTLGRLIVQTFTTHVSNHLINFPMCTECKKEGQKPIKRPKTKDQNSFTLFVQNNKIININNNSLPPSLAKFSPGTGNKVLLNVGLTAWYSGIVTCKLMYVYAYMHALMIRGSVGSAHVAMQTM